MRSFVTGRNPVLSVLRNQKINVLFVKIDKSANKDEKINEIIALCKNKNATAPLRLLLK